MRTKSGITSLFVAALFTFACVAAFASDMTTPLGPSVIVVGVILFALMIAAGVLSFRSGDRGYEAAMAALVLPVAFCGYAVFNLREGPSGQPPSGVAAQALPALERLQANILPSSPDTKSALLLEAALKTDGDAVKTDALEQIPGLKAAASQKYLYGVAEKFGDISEKQAVARAVLERRLGQPIFLDIKNEDNSTIYVQYIEGSSLRFASVRAGPHGVRARLSTNKEEVAMEGALLGSNLTLTGATSPADRKVPLTMTASMGPDLTFSGALHFAGADAGDDIPFAIRPF